MASNSLHLTTMCLQYKPTVVACFCIHLACKWSNWEIPQSNEGKDWFWYVDKTVTLEQLEQLTAEFLVIFDKCPTKLKRKIMSISATQNPTLPPAISGSLFDMEPRKIRPPDGSQDGMPFHPGVITAGGRPPPHHMSHVPGDSSKLPADGEAFKKLHQISSSLPGASGPTQQVVQQAPRDYREYKEKKERELLAQQAGVARDGHHGALHLNKSVPGGSSKHHQPGMPPGGAGILPKPGPPHHKHPPPMSSSSTRPGSGVSQARDAVRREQAFAREAAKRDSGQRGGEHMFAPPIRHHEPKENTPLLQALGEHLQHHGLTMDPTPSMGNHIGSGINSGINCNVNSRKDNHEWTGSETIGDVDVRHGIDKSNVLSSRGGGEAKSTENRNLVPVHVDPAKRSHQQGFESLSRHGRVPSDHRSSGTSGGDVRNVKEEVLSNPPTSDTQRHLYNHNKHGASSDRLDHGRHRRPGVSEQFPSRPTAEGERKPNTSDLVDRKPNIQDLGDRKPDLVDRKSNVADVVDRKSSASDVDRKPNVTDIVDRKPNILDLPDRKPNIADLHSSFSENRHESSCRRLDASKHQPHHSTPVKKEPKLEPGIPKKDEVTDAVTKSAISTGRPPPPSHPPPQPLLQHPQQPPALSLSQQPATLLPTLPSHHHQEKHKSRSKSPSQAHEKPPPPPPSHQQRSRSPAVPPRVKSPISAAVSTNISKRSESPYHGKTKSTPSLSTHSKTGTAHIQPISEEKSIPEARNRRPETPVTKPLLTSDQSNTTIKLEADASQHTLLKVSSGSSQKLSATADKAVTPVQRESPYRASKSTRQRTPPSSSSKKHPASLPEIISTPLSPFGSPPPPTPTTPGSATKSSQGSLRTTNRNRTSSSSSEPELVPVVKKLDEIAGYENIIRDSKMGIKLPNRVPDIIPPIRDRGKKDDTSSVPLASASSSVTLSVAKELKPPDLIRPFDTLTHVAKPGLPDDLGAVAFPESNSANGTFGRTAIPPASLAADDTIGGSSIQSVGVIDITTMGEQIQPIENIHSVTSSLSVPEHHHRSEKKKKKKDSKEHREHRDHKHKNKDKNRDEKKHKHKHKEKDKDRHKVEKVEGSAPIKITIPKDKIIGQTLAPSDTSAGIKLKIQKERIKGSDSTGNSPQTTPAAPSGGIKIKISKEVIGNFNSSNASISAPSSETPSSSTSRKRDRSSPRSSELTTPPGPPAKSARLVASANEQQRRGGSSSGTYGKQNGVEHHRSRGSHYSAPGNKVVQKVADPHNVYQSKGKSSSYTSSGSQP